MKENCESFSVSSLILASSGREHVIAKDKSLQAMKVSSNRRFLDTKNHFKPSLGL